VGLNVWFLWFYCLGFFKYGLIFRVLDFWNITRFVFVQSIGIKNECL
jgi:hypothetical protein